MRCFNSLSYRLLITYILTPSGTHGPSQAVWFKNRIFSHPTTAPSYHNHTACHGPAQPLRPPRPRPPLGGAPTPNGTELDRSRIRLASGVSLPRSYTASSNPPILPGSRSAIFSYCNFYVNKNQSFCETNTSNLSSNFIV